MSTDNAVFVKQVGSSWYVREMSLAYADGLLLEGEQQLNQAMQQGDQFDCREKAVVWADGLYNNLPNIDSVVELVE